MERTYCDRCGQSIDKKSWIRYYDDRVDDPSRGWRSQFGSFEQKICGNCLDELKPAFHSKVATEPAYIERVIVASPPIAVSCTDCWLCRLKRSFRRAA